MVKDRRQKKQGPRNANKQHGGRCGKAQEIRLKRKAKLDSEGSLGWWGPVKEVLGSKEVGIPRDTAVKINCIWYWLAMSQGESWITLGLCPWNSQARILEWVVILFSRGSSWPRDWTWDSCIADGFFTIWTTREAPLLTILASWTEGMWKCNSALKNDWIFLLQSTLHVFPLLSNYKSPEVGSVLFVQPPHA